MDSIAYGEAINLKDNFFESSLSGIEFFNGMHKNIILRFWAPWCASCRINESVVYRVYNDISNRVTCFKINVDREVELVQALGIQYLPEMIIFDKNGKKHHLVGEVTAQQILKLCQ